jgi:putative ABC transport system permease protein
MLNDHFNIAWRNLKTRKLRAWLTMIGIIISVATIFTLVALSIGLQGAVEDQFEALGGDKFFIQPEGQLGPPQAGASVTMTKDDVDVIKKVNGIKDITYFTAGNAKVEYGDEERFFPVYGIPEDGIDLYFESGSFEIEFGRSFSGDGNRELIIGNHYKTRNIFKRPIDPGDTFLVNGEEFKVRGIMSIIGNPEDDRSLITTAKDMEEVFGIGDRVDFIMVQIEEGEDMNEVVSRVERRLDRFRDVDHKTRDYTILTPEEILEIFGTILIVITAFLGGVAAISLLVGAIGITNTMYTSVIERTKQIGIMKALGAKNSDVLKIFLIESGLLGLVGGIIGVLIGIGISETIEYIAFVSLGTTLLQTTYPLWLILGCLAFAFFTGAIAGSLPAYNASRTNVVDAIRYE